MLLIKLLKTSSEKSSIERKKVVLLLLMGCLEITYYQPEPTLKVVYRKTEPQQKGVQRFFTVDPLQFEYAHLTPYNYAGNKSITGIDLDGMQSTSDKKTLEVGLSGQTTVFKQGVSTINHYETKDPNNNMTEDSIQGDPDKLKEAAKYGVEYATDYQKTHFPKNPSIALCNQGVRGAIINYTGEDLTGSVNANTMAQNFAKGKVKGFKEYDFESWEKLQADANRGLFIVGAADKSDLNQSGHMVLIVPGKLGKGDKWRSGPELPSVMDTGNNGRNQNVPMSHVSGKTTVGKMKFYVLSLSIPSESKDGDDVIRLTKNIHFDEVSSQHIRAFQRLFKGLGEMGKSASEDIKKGYELQKSRIDTLKMRRQNNAN